MDDTDKLGPEEDAELRRLHMLRGFGTVGGSITARYETLRGRDRRAAVREPEDNSLATPVEKKRWAEAPRRLASAPGGSLGTQRVVGDSREVFGQRPETRRGLGLFRR